MKIKVINMEENTDFEEQMDENFEDMIMNSLDRKDDFMPGDKLKGIIIQIADDTVFVDVQGKSEAMMESRELFDKNGDLLHKVGDEIDVYVVSTNGGEIQLTKTIGKGKGNPQILEIAYKNEIPVEGTPTQVIKGGYSVSISDIRCFCPFSQIDLKQPANEEDMLNQKMNFKIIQFSEGGRNIVLSRRVLLEEERALSQEKLKESLKEGNIIECTVSNIVDFGIFVDMGGIDGLIPKSELSWSRNSSPSTFARGQKVTAKILSLDWVKKKFALSIKETLPHPWEKTSEMSEGDVVSGIVRNFITAGAFVELTPGLEGFIHISKLSPVKRINKPDEAVTKGETVNVKILQINNEDKKISLELLTEDANPWDMPLDELQGSVQKVIIESSRPQGLNVRMENGMSGFIPKDQLMDNSGNLQDNYGSGKELNVLVKEVNRSRKSCIFSERGALKQEEQDAYKNFQEKNQTSTSSALGSQFQNAFADLQKKVGKE
jgi:small subunit ribosomal protein S1